ncbi:MAG: amidohydrolase family protein [Streptosporangiaceae bacterium]
MTGGTIVTPGGTTRADLLIRDGRITAMGSAAAGADGGLDATGCYVLPGGVDPHTHLMAAPVPATAAAARGGTTTALSFTSPRGSERDLDGLLRNQNELHDGGIAIDVGLHAAIYDPDHITAADLAEARRAGAAAIKVFLAYPELGIMCSDRRLRELMNMAGPAGLVVAVHCENASLIEALEHRASAARQPGSGPRIFASTRPPEAEDEAVGRVLAASAATGAACYLVHLSTAGAVRRVRAARAASRAAAQAEVCVHHLLLNDGCYDESDAGRYLVCPPLRSAGDIEALWAAIADETIGTVGSDHCQAKTPTGEWLASAGHRHAYGLAGIGPRLPLLLSAAVPRGLTIPQVARLAAENPARAFGHYPRKGALLPGSDADAVIFDPAGETVLPADGFGDGTGDSVYAGRVLRGRIRAVLLRGRLIVAEDEFVGGQPSGMYLAARS